jgi:nitric oxide reductase subunit B
MESLVWLRVPGDILFAAGAVFLAVYALALLFRPGRREADAVALPHAGTAD